MIQSLTTKCTQQAQENQLTSLGCKFNHVFITGSNELLYLHKQSFKILDVCTTEFDHPAMATKKVKHADTNSINDTHLLDFLK